MDKATNDGEPISQEMDGGGWVKLHRKALDSDVFAVPELWHLFTWCLLTANHTTRHVPIKVGRGRSVRTVGPGQFIYGRKSKAKELGLPESTLSDRMKRLEAMGAISIQADTTNSIVTIVNWGLYQRKSGEARHPSNTQPTAKRRATNTQATAVRHPTDTYKKGEKGKKGENVKNGEKAKADDDDDSFSWKEAHALARELENAGTFNLRGGEKHKATESERREVLRACKLARDGGIEMAWLQEAATSTRDSKPTENAYGYFLKMVRETCSNHGIDFNQAAADLDVPAEFRRPNPRPSVYREGDDSSGEPAHHDCAPCVPEGQDGRQDVSAPDRRQDGLGGPGVVAG